MLFIKDAIFKTVKFIINVDNKKKEKIVDIEKI